MAHKTLIWDFSRIVLLYSFNAGDTWSYVDLERAIGIRGPVYSVAFDPEDPDIVYVSAVGDIVKSTDAGKSWVLPVATKPKNASFGILVEDPMRSGHLFAAGGRSILESDDGAKNWREIESPIDKLVLDLLYDPENSVLYVGTEKGLFLYKKL